MERVIVGNEKSLADYLPPMRFGSFWKSPESLGDYLENFKGKPWADAGFEDDRPDWAGCRTLTEAIKLAQTGWKEGVSKVVKIRDTVNALNPVAPKAVKYGICGAIPDVPRAISGNIMNMRQMDSAFSKRKPVITLLSSMGANCGTSGAAITNRAAVVAAIVDQVEARGFAVEVIAIATTKSGSNQAVTAVRVKSAGQPVDIGRLAYGVGHVSMFRKLIFASWTADKDAQFLGSSLGSSYNLDKKDLEGKNAYYLPGPERTNVFDTEDSACKAGLDYLINNLIDQKCPPFKDMKKKEIKDSSGLKFRFPMPDDS